MKDAMDFTKEITKLMKRSPKRDLLFKQVKDKLCSDSPGIRVICPTWWTVNAEAFESIIENYDVLEQVWEESLDMISDSELRARINGVKMTMRRFEFFFGVMLSNKILRHSDNLSKTLQKVEMSAAEGQSIAEMTGKTLERIRSNDAFEAFWKVTLIRREKLAIDAPVLPRQRRLPARYSEGEQLPQYPTNVDEYFKQIYFNAIDSIVSTIRERFNQDGFQKYVLLENLLLHAWNKESYQKELQSVCNFYKDDLNKELLDTQSMILQTNKPGDRRSIHSKMSGSFTRKCQRAKEHFSLKLSQY